MSGNINFWKNIYESIFCIRNQFLDIFLCVKTSIITWLIGCRRNKITKFTNSLHIPSPNFSKFWESLYFDPPALIIAKMQMQYIVFVFSHGINVLLDLLLCEEMPCYIKHQSPPSKFRIISNFKHWNLPVYMF